MKCITILITTPNQKVSGLIIEQLLDNKLVSCVNVIPAVKSVYWWKGKICKSKEQLLIFKSIKNKFKKIVKIVKKSHPYEIPEIVSFDISDGNSEYLKWIVNTVNSRR
ncbi:MAG: divalent-cation tolerance protein CutA [Endomicrobiaceae bacterium]|nr:divalent-cation tolerance protein CutA [Endomicrobiaceae bacterium]